MEGPLFVSTLMQPAWLSYLNNTECWVLLFCFVLEEGCFAFLFFFLEMGSLYVVLLSLNSLKTMLVFNSQRSTCLCLRGLWVKKRVYHLTLPSVLVLLLLGDIFFDPESLIFQQNPWTNVKLTLQREKLWSFKFGVGVRTKTHWKRRALRWKTLINKNLKNPWELPMSLYFIIY